MNQTSISFISYLVEAQKTGLFAPLTPIIYVFFGALVTYYLTGIQRRNQLKKMRLYPVLISASFGILHALEPFTKENERKKFRPDFFLCHIEDSFKNYQNLISGEGIIALLSKKEKNELFKMEYALHDFHIHAKEISTKWLTMHSFILEFATEKRLSEGLSEDLTETIKKIENDFEDSFFKEIKHELNELYKTPYSNVEISLLELLIETATKLKDVGCGGLKIKWKINRIMTH